MYLANLDRLSRQRSFQRGVALDGQKWQCFSLAVFNTAGTLQHQMSPNSDFTGLESQWMDRVIGARVAVSNTPTVAAGVQFVGGGGFAAGSSTTDHFVFNTAEQDPQFLIAFAEPEYYSGNNVRPRVWPRIVSRNVAGITRQRLELTMTNDLTGASWNFNTTTLPVGQIVIIRILAALT